MYYVVKYAGPFGFIKPWTAVRDSKTFSQQFLTPSIIEGMRQKLEVSEIVRYRLAYGGISVQQEQTQTRGIEIKKREKKAVRAQSILDRGILLQPTLSLAFSNIEDANKAITQHICLCRNEDILLPEGEMLVMDEDEFNRLPGFELRFGEGEDSFLVGFNRFDNGSPMYGWLEINGNPIIAREDYE